MSIPCIVRVLVVDNDLETRTQVVRLLKRAGYLVQAPDGLGVELGEAAKKLAVVFKPHVVIMDLRLSDEHADDRSGLDLWKDSSFSSARCILYSAYLNQNYKISIDALRQEGVEGVIGKEDDPQILLNEVERVARKGCGCRQGLSIKWPAAWNERAIINCLYKEPENMSPEIVMDVFGRLFPENRSLSLKALEGTAKSSIPVARGRAVLFQAWPDDLEPVVVKLAPRDQIQVESDAYRKHIQGRLRGQFCAELQRKADFWNLGGICYSFMGSSQTSMETFAAFYRQTRFSEDILTPLEHFFEEVWRNHYSGTHPRLAVNLLSAYDSFLKLRERLEAFPDQEKTIPIPGFPGKFTNPAVWIPTHEEDSYFTSARQAVTHGDLHGDNLFIEKGHAWAIDFERSGEGHILRDFVELEEDIITRLVVLPESDLHLFYQFAVILTQPLLPTEPIVLPEHFRENEEIKKAVEVINGLRMIAYRVTRFEDMHEYYWGLLLDAFFSLKLSERNSPKWLRGLLLSSLLCTRLKEWGRMWPPEGWPPLDYHHTKSPISDGAYVSTATNKPPVNQGTETEKDLPVPLSTRVLAAVILFGVSLGVVGLLWAGMQFFELQMQDHIATLLYLAVFAAIVFAVVGLITGQVAIDAMLRLISPLLGKGKKSDRDTVDSEEAGKSNDPT